jgi:DNA-binding transcriptional MerR regulator
MSTLTFTLGEVAALVGITAKSILHYHDTGLLPQPERDPNNYRRYDMVQVLQIQQILHLKQFGLSLEQIRIILQSDHADELTHVVLSQHAHHIRDQISRLQHQLELTQNVLDGGESLSQPRFRDKPAVSSLTAFSDAVKRRSSGVSDILIEIETEVMGKLDQFDWDAEYEQFWHQVGQQLIDVLADEGLFIFWMERYLALANLDTDDLQGKAWLDELRHSPARRMLMRALLPQSFPILPERGQQKIFKLLPSLLYQDGSPLQKHFLQLLISNDSET